MIPSEIFKVLLESPRFWIRSRDLKRSIFTQACTSTENLENHISLSAKTGFYFFDHGQLSVKEPCAPAPFHSPQKNNNPQLMTQQFGLKNVMLSYTALCIYWMTLLPATQQNIITSWNLKPLQYAQKYCRH